MKKFTALLLILSLIEISCATITSSIMERRFPERKKGSIVITKKDGQQIEGELITVKPNSLLLLDTEGKDVSVDIADIKVIRVMKKSKVWQGVGIGFLIGGGGGVISGFVFPAYIEETNWAPIWYGILGGAAGLLLGGIVGAFAGIDKTIQIEGMTDSEIKEAMNKLRKKARIRDYR